MNDQALQQVNEDAYSRNLRRAGWNLRAAQLIASIFSILMSREFLMCAYNELNIRE